MTLEPPDFSIQDLTLVNLTLAANLFFLSIFRFLWGSAAKILIEY